jgi:hypothetical protein
MIQSTVHLIQAAVSGVDHAPDISKHGFSLCGDEYRFSSLGREDYVVENLGIG